MTADLVDAVLNKIIGVEGGVSDHPNDRGGLTNFGLTKPFLQTVTCRDWSDEDVRSMTRQRAEGVYKLWLKMRRLDQLPDDYLLAWVVIDFAIIAGERRAIRALQKFMGLYTDGIAGTETQGAWHRLNAEERTQAAAFVVAERTLHHFNDLAANPDQLVFARGWGARVAEQIRACAA